MSNDSPVPGVIVPSNQPAFATEQYKQVGDLLRNLMTVIAQLITVFLVANATVIGYALTTRIAGILLIDPLFPIGLVVLYYIFARSIAPVVYMGVSLEERYGQPGEDWLMSTFWSTLSVEYVEQLREISAIPDGKQRMKRLRRVKMPWLGTGRGIGRMTVAVVALGQIVGAFVLWLNFGWRLF